MVNLPVRPRRPLARSLVLAAALAGLLALGACASPAPPSSMADARCVLAPAEVSAIVPTVGGRADYDTTGDVQQCRYSFADDPGRVNVSVEWVGVATGFEPDQGQFSAATQSGLISLPAAGDDGYTAYLVTASESTAYRFGIALDGFGVDASWEIGRAFDETVGELESVFAELSAAWLAAAEADATASGDGPATAPQEPAAPAASCADTIGTMPEALSGGTWSQSASFPRVGDDVIDGLFEAEIPRGGCAYAAPNGVSYLVIYEGTGAWSRWDAFVQSIGFRDRNRDSGPWSTQTPSGRWILMNFYLYTSDNIEAGRSGLSWKGSQFDQNPLVVAIVAS